VAVFLVHKRKLITNEQFVSTEQIFGLVSYDFV